MATITGTAGSDTLIGTPGNDVLVPLGSPFNGAPDYLSGGNGGDTYDLTMKAAGTTVHTYIIDDNGTDGAVDEIIGVGALHTTASLGYEGFATAIRVGDDLQIHTPGTPHRFRKPAKPAHTITIVDHYGGEQVESMVAGGIRYALPTGQYGTLGADLMAGTDFGDILYGRDGNDYIVGNGGDDTLRGGIGDDEILAGDGHDVVHGQSGNDHLYAGSGNDDVRGGRGADILKLGIGDDVGRGGADNDYLYGQDGNDLLIGGKGSDLLSGGRGNDTLKGGTGGDVYRFGYDLDNLGTTDLPGHDVIVERGEKPTYGNADRIDLFGYYGPSSGNSGEAFARVAFARVGDDMVMTSDNGEDSLTVVGQFKAGSKTQVETLDFWGSYWSPLSFEILDANKVDVSNDRAYAGGDTGQRNEIIFGTDGADEIFGNSGTNFIWLGGGADVLIYKEADPQPLSGLGGGAVNDIVDDFDIAEDMLDFTEIKGLTLADLTISQDAQGDATIFWDSGTFEVSDIFVELRGVAQTDVTADLFLFA